MPKESKPKTVRTIASLIVNGKDRVDYFIDHVPGMGYCAVVSRRGEIQTGPFNSSAGNATKDARKLYNQCDQLATDKARLAAWNKGEPLHAGK